MINNEVREVAQNIAKYYLGKNNGDVDAANIAAMRLGISSIEIEPDYIRLTTARPGLLIGVRGENIAPLEKWLKTTVKVVEDMDPLFNHLVVRNHSEKDELDYDYDYGADLAEPEDSYWAANEGFTPQ